MDEQKPLVDVNQASYDELHQIPGIGQTLAKRIISSRPFEKLDDLLNVQGITGSQLVKWLPLLTVKPVSTPEDSNEAPTSTSGVDEKPTEAEVILEKNNASEGGIIENSPVIEKQNPPQPSSENKTQSGVDNLKNKDASEKVHSFTSELPERLRQKLGQTAPLSQVEALVWGGGVALLVLIMAIVFTLGILAGINGSLSFISSTRYAELQNQVAVINLQIKQLQQDSSSLQDRMNTLEGLSGRVAAVEKANKDLNTQINANAQQIQALAAQAKQLETDINTLKAHNQAYDQFFNGLKSLLDNVVPKATQ